MQNLSNNMAKLPDENLSDLMKQVAKIAKSDGKVTDEEYNILQQLSYDVAEYMIAIEESNVEGEIDEGKETELIRLKEKIMRNAKRIAEEDGIIDSDEQAILNKLVEILKN